MNPYRTGVTILVAAVTVSCFAQVSILQELRFRGGISTTPKAPADPTSPAGLEKSSPATRNRTVDPIGPSLLCLAAFAVGGTVGWRFFKLASR